MKYINRLYLVIFTLLIAAALLFKIAAYYEREELKQCSCFDEIEEHRTIDDYLSNKKEGNEN